MKPSNRFLCKKAGENTVGNQGANLMQGLIFSLSDKSERHKDQTLSSMEKVFLFHKICQLTFSNITVHCIRGSEFRII